MNPSNPATKKVPPILEYEIKTVQGIPNFEYKQYRHYNELSLNGKFLNKFPHNFGMNNDYKEAIDDAVSNTTTYLRPYQDGKTIMIVFKDNINPNKNNYDYNRIWNAQGLVIS